MRVNLCERILRWSALDARFERHDAQNRQVLFLHTKRAFVQSDCSSFSFHMVQG